MASLPCIEAPKTELFDGLGTTLLYCHRLVPGTQSRARTVGKGCRQDCVHGVSVSFRVSSVWPSLLGPESFFGGEADVVSEGS